MRTHEKSIHVPSDILLAGRPNVGKSVLFSRMTGVRTIASNYPGTTVEYAEGKMRHDTTTYTLVDAPGTYSLEPFDEAARVTIDLIEETDRIINVVDATHLERHLPFTLELLAQKKPLVIAMNMMDEARHQGIEIDTDSLADKLGVPVVPIVARSGEGVLTLIERTCQLPRSKKLDHGQLHHPEDHPHLAHGLHKSKVEEHKHLDSAKVWQQVGALVNDIQKFTSPRRNFGLYMDELSVHPVWGTIIALIAVAMSFSLVRILGEFLISGGIGIVGEPWITLPFGTEQLFDRLLLPLYIELSELLGPGTLLHKFLLGSLIDGKIDFEQSFGILSSGLFIPLGVVLPYLISFYFVLSLLEDSGYLPRLAVFLDNFMHRLGLHGYAIVTILLGLGCNVPGIMATRIMETKRQRFITASLISIAVPCAALQAMILGLVGDYGIMQVVLVYGILFVVWMLISLILRFTSKEFLPELLIEIPPFRLPTSRAIVSKMWFRITSFLREALPVVIATILVVNILYQLDVLRFLSDWIEPLITTLWGMPKESILPLLVGILRKDLGMGMFAPLDLSLSQLITGSVVLSMFFPCIATLVVLFRELGLKDGIKSIGIMLVAVMFTGTALNIILN